MRSNRVMVTGASAGIGRATAEQLAASGRSVVGLSRREVAIEGMSWLAADLDTDAAEQAVTAGIERLGGLDALVCCAGWGLAGSVEATTVVDARAQLETNFFGVVRATRAALPALRASGGRLVILSSIGGIIGLPFQAYYSASKFALEGWAEALWWELRPQGVSVSLLEPGNFATGFTDARRSVGLGDEDPYASAQTTAIATMERDERGGQPPEVVARAVIKLLEQRRPPLRRSVGPASERVGLLAKRLLPQAAFAAASKSSLGV
jgi:short-subunit dehydrogenase